MNRRMGWFLSSLLVAAGWNMSVAVADDYVLHGRVSFDAGNTLIKGADDADWVYATVNTLVLAGDTLWVEDGGMGETEFAQGSFLRLADGSKAEVAALPPSLTLRTWTGSFYVQRLKRSSGDAVIQTPAANVEIEPNSAVRIDVIGDGATTVTVRWGQAVVRTEAGGNVTVRSGNQVWVDPGLLPSNPTPFSRAEGDAFDTWNRERAEALAGGDTKTPVQIDSSNLGYSDLATYGEWVYVDSRPYWRPTVVVDYVPYRYGSWSYVPAAGYCWVGTYPFSYITSHHGYWRHHNRYGWIWEYDRPWSPAWATTIRHGDYFVWSPVDRYYRPCSVYDSAYFNVGGVQFSVFGSSYVLASQVGYGFGYCHPASYTGGFNYRHINPGHVTIWNINIGNRPHVRTPYNDNVFTTRNYFPRRSIRGTQTVGTSSRTANQLARSLETRSGRDRFAAVRQTGGQGVRTADGIGVRSAQVRRTTITADRPSYARATPGNPVSATRAVERERINTRSRGGGSSADVATRSRVSTPDRETPTRTREAAPTRTMRSESTTARPIRTPESTNVGTEVRRTTPVRTTDSVTRTDRTGRSSGITRTAPSSGSTTITRDSRPVRTTTPSTSVQVRTPVRSTSIGTTVRPSTPGVDVRSPRVTATRTPSRSQAESPRSNTQRLVPSVRHQEPAPTRSAAPQVRQSSPRVSPTVPQVRQPAPQARPQVRQPSPQVRQSAPQVRQPAPQVRQPSPSAPRSVVSTPSSRNSSVGRQSTSRQSAPTPRAPSTRNTGRGR